MHVCMLHVYTILDPWPWCMYVWCTYLWSLIPMNICMMHVSTMQIYMILDPDACIHEAGFFSWQTDQRTNEQADSRSWMMTFSVNRHTDQQASNFSKNIWWRVYALSMIVVRDVCLLRCINDVVASKRECGWVKTNKVFDQYMDTELLTQLTMICFAFYEHKKHFVSIAN